MPASPMPAGLRPSETRTRRSTDRSPGSPNVVARWGKRPVPRIEAILNSGLPGSHVLS